LYPKTSRKTTISGTLSRLGWISAIDLAVFSRKIVERLDSFPGP
jgi:hypothetical protein